MKYTTAILALAAAASAQDLTLFPECSLPCIIDAVGKSTSCQTTDFACVCSHMDAVKTAATPCVVEKCGMDTALNKVLPATEKFCAAVPSGGGDDDTPTSSSGTTAAPATSTNSEESTPSPSETEAPGDDDGDDEASSTESHGSMVTPTPSGGDDTTTPPASTTTSVSTAGAAGVAAGVGSLGMMLLGAVAAL